MTDLNHEQKSRQVFHTPANLRHHLRYSIAVCRARTPTRAELVRAGAAPYDYLSEFGPDSRYWPEIATLIYERRGITKR